MPAGSSAWRQLPPGGQPDRKDDNIRKAVTDRDLNASVNRRSGAIDGRQAGHRKCTRIVDLSLVACQGRRSSASRAGSWARATAALTGVPPGSSAPGPSEGQRARRQVLASGRAGRDRDLRRRGLPFPGPGPRGGGRNRTRRRHDVPSIGFEDPGATRHPDASGADVTRARAVPAIQSAAKAWTGHLPACPGRLDWRCDQSGCREAHAVCARRRLRLQDPAGRAGGNSRQAHARCHGHRPDGRRRAR